MQPISDRSMAVSNWHFSPPNEILQSRLFAAGGYLVVCGLFDEETLQGMRAEADVVRPEAPRVFVEDSDGTEGRGGYPARAYRSGPARDLHWALYGCQQMAETLGRLCGITVSATGGGTWRLPRSPSRRRRLRPCRHHVAHRFQGGWLSRRVGSLP